MRLIDADELLTDPYFNDETIPERALYIKAVKESPTIDPMKRGHWIEDDDGDGRHCSVCGHDYCYMLGDPEIFEFCPFCGAKMDEEAEK